MNQPGLVLTPREKADSHHQADWHRIQEEGIEGGNRKAAIHTLTREKIAETFPHLFHITHFLNIPSILQRGLRSHLEAHAREWVTQDISEPKAQNLRQRREPIHRLSIHEYVPLYYNPKNPMLSVRRELQSDLVLLKISRDALTAGKTIYADGNAASGETVFSAEESIIAKSLDVLCAKTWADIQDGKRRRCAEVLIHPEVPSRCIAGYVCSTRKMARHLEDVYELSNVEVNTALFFS